MIPKIIHYCWFGHNKMPKAQVKNINEWKRECPNYKFIEWSERNFNVFNHEFTAKAYKQHNWAFVSDYVRLYALKKFGGIYLDTDIKILKPFDSLLKRNAFMAIESWCTVDDGLASGAIPNEQNISNILQIYDYIGLSTDYLGDFRDNCVTIVTKYLWSKGFKNCDKQQQVNGCTLFPTKYFNPKDRATGKINITSNAYTIHSYANSWTSKPLDMRRKIDILCGNILKRIIGPKRFNYIYEKYLRILGRE